MHEIPCIVLAELKTELQAVGGGAALFLCLVFLSAERGINTELAKRECREVRYLTDGKPYFAVGFLSRSGGYEIFNKFFKGCIASRTLPTYGRNSRRRPATSSWASWITFPSLTLRLERCPDRCDLDWQDYIVLNSTSNLSKAIRPLGDYERIHYLLDNDKAGNGSYSGTVGGIRAACPGTRRTYTEVTTTRTTSFVVNGQDKRNGGRRSRNRREGNGRQDCRKKEKQRR